MALSAESAKLYDRQIRLWGVKSQSRVQNARVLFVGFNALAAEICKNLVLAGIRDVLIVDWHVVEPQDLAHLFIDASSVGQNRGEASVARIQLLNPQAQIRAVPITPPSDKSTLLSQIERATRATGAETDSDPLPFDVLVATDIPTWELLEFLNDACRAQQTYRAARLASASQPNDATSRVGGFVAAQSFGHLGFVFFDFGRFSYTKKREDGSGADEMSFEQQFCSLRDSRAARNIPESGRQSITPLFYAFQGLYDYRPVRHSDANQQPPDLSQVRMQILSNYQLPETYKLDTTLLQNMVSWYNSELSGTTAVLGGFAAQEIIKFIAQNDSVLRNWILFNSQTGDATVEYIH